MVKPNVDSTDHFGVARLAANLGHHSSAFGSLLVLQEHLSEGILSMLIPIGSRMEGYDYLNPDEYCISRRPSSVVTKPSKRLLLFVHNDLDNCNPITRCTPHSWRQATLRVQLPIVRHRSSQNWQVLEDSKQSSGDHSHG